jgi:hypothetical protein
LTRPYLVRTVKSSKRMALWTPENSAVR